MHHIVWYILNCIFCWFVGVTCNEIFRSFCNLYVDRDLGRTSSSWTLLNSFCFRIVLVLPGKFIWKLCIESNAKQPMLSPFLPYYYIRLFSCILIRLITISHMGMQKTPIIGRKSYIVWDKAWFSITCWNTKFLISSAKPDFSILERSFWQNLLGLKYISL